MSFDIPGYFLDKKTNKLFKIAPHGPYSLAELRKRVEREEAEEKVAAAAAAIKHRVPKRVSNNITHFLKQRAHIGATFINSFDYLMSQLKPRSSITLNDSIQKFNNMLVETTEGREDYGEMFIASRLGIEHLGYEIDPQFHVWKTDGIQYNMLNTTSMKLCKRRFENEGINYRLLAGTSGGTLWSQYFQVLPPLISEEMDSMFLDQENGTMLSPKNIISSPTYSYNNACHSYKGRKFEQRKDMFWCFNFNDLLDSVVVGGDQKIYHLNQDFKLQSFRKVKSSIFTTHIPILQPSICWAGSRNGKIHLYDWRQDCFSPQYFSHRFTQSSSVVNIQTLNTSTGFELLTVSMDGSIDIWDARRPKKSSNYQQEEPIFSLQGHVNESSHYLGFDIDTENHLVMAAGSDGVVRVWSYLSSYHDGHPIWKSRKHDTPIPACKFKNNSSTYPSFQEGWNLIMNDPPARQCPGVLLFGTTETGNNQASIEWLTAIK